MKRIIALAFAGLLALAMSAQAASANRVELLVPAYFYPGGKKLAYWDQLALAAPKVPLLAIMNPSSGPGKGADLNYINAVTRLRAAGGKVIGYVPTTYGARPINAVIQDILDYQSFYPLDGIFLDEMGNDASAASLDYYASLYRYIKSINPNWRVIGNPGTATQAVYLSYPSADAVVLFEDSTRVYQRYRPPAWALGVASAGIGHLVTNVADFAAARAGLVLARQRNAGLVYFTSDKIAGNPWDTLPPWWTQLVTEVCIANAGNGC